MSNNISTVGMTHEQWLVARKRGIGSSDVGAIVGLSKYRSPRQVYLEKIGDDLPRSGANQSSETGLFFEPRVAEYYTHRTGRKVEPDDCIRVHPEHDFLMANVDRIIEPNDRGPGILEIKMASDYAAGSWDTQVPLPYFCQVQHQMSVTGFRWAEIALLVSIREFHVIPIPRDDEFIAQQNELLIRFWRENVEKHVAPTWTYLDLDSLFGKPGTSIEINSELAEKARLLVFLKTLKGKAEKAYDALRQEFKLYMGETETLTINGTPFAVWKNTKEKEKFDEKRFAQENPALYAQYLRKADPERRFTVKDGAAQSLPPSTEKYELPALLTAQPTGDQP